MDNKTHFKVSKLKKLFCLLGISILLFSSTYNLNAQTNAPHINEKIRTLFFNLSVDSCIDKITADITQSKKYKFFNTAGYDTMYIFDTVFDVAERFSMNKYYELKSQSPHFTNCDSVFIQLQPIIMGMIENHSKTKPRILHGHRLSIINYFSDSSSVWNNYQNIIDSVSKSLNKEFHSGDFTLDNVIKGNTTTINISRQSTGFVHERNIELVVRKYSDCYVLKIEYVKITTKAEECNN